ncbi:hypothetical protein M8C21_021729, partial [Ambrosia artemisiifolia]
KKSRRAEVDDNPAMRKRPLKLSSLSLSEYEIQEWNRNMEWNETYETEACGFVGGTRHGILGTGGLEILGLHDARESIPRVLFLAIWSDKRYVVVFDRVGQSTNDRIKNVNTETRHDNLLDPMSEVPMASKSLVDSRESRLKVVLALFPTFSSAIASAKTLSYDHIPNMSNSVTSSSGYLLWNSRLHLFLKSINSFDVGIYDFTPNTPCIESISSRSKECKRLVSTSVIIQTYPSSIIPASCTFLKNREAKSGKACTTKTRVCIVLSLYSSARIQSSEAEGFHHQ